VRVQIGACLRDGDARRRPHDSVRFLVAAASPRTLSPTAVLAGRPAASRLKHEPTGLVGPAQLAVAERTCHSSVSRHYVLGGEGGYCNSRGLNQFDRLQSGDIVVMRHDLRQLAPRSFSVAAAEYGCSLRTRFLERRLRVGPVRVDDLPTASNALEDLGRVPQCRRTLRT
jgi:hypothetical protein